MRTRRKLLRGFAVAWFVLLCGAPHALAQSTVEPAPADESKLPDERKSLTEVNKELTNPISSIWSITFQENTYWVNTPAAERRPPVVTVGGSVEKMPTRRDDRIMVNTQFQPVLPLSLTDNWNLITRPVIPVLNSNPYINLESGNVHRVTGFGDSTFVTMLSPTENLTGRWLLALGPTFVFPTATNSRLGQDKWQMGPAGVVGYLGEKFVVGLFPQQWWSVGGAGSNTVSQLSLQYFAAYFLPNGWGVATSPIMLVNWYANKSGNMVTFPIGLGVSKVIKIGPLPIKIALQPQYMPVHPDDFGQKWDIQVTITPVIPKLIKGNLLDSM